MMRTIYKSLILYIGIMMAQTATAQTITFDTSDYAAVGVYDAWEQSPFRTGQLAGHAAVVSNRFHGIDDLLGFAPNESENMLALQRSRFGSNTFGVRIDLKEPFRLTKYARYLHVMVQMADKPAPSRMMVIGLGKRVEDEWSWQTGQDEQFWALSSVDIEPSEHWQDVVFSFKGFSYSVEENAESGIDIYSLVLIPDLRSPHADTQDFACYFDQILIDGSSAKRFSTERYVVGFDKNQQPTRSDRHLNQVGLSGGSDGTQTVTGLSSWVYNDKTTTTLFSAKAGETVRPTLNYTGVWMSGYVYLDWGNDGVFSATLADDMRPAEGSDVVSYNALQNGDRWYRSDGTIVANGNQIGNGVPAFTIPETTPAGFYRMRYKVDWNSIDPAGNVSDDNHIVSNGGGMVDVMIDIHTDQVRVSDQQLNGAVLCADGRELNSLEADYGKPFTICMSPAPGFGYSGIRVRYGYHLDGDDIVDDNPQYYVANYPATAFDENDCLTLPASVMRGGDVLIEGFFTEGEEKPQKGDTITSLSQLSNEKAYFIHALTGEGYLAWNTTISNHFVSLRGVTNTSYQGLPADEQAAAIYQQAVDPFDPTTSWQILQKEGRYYLYNVGNECFVTLSGRDYIFTDVETPLDAIRTNSANETIDGESTSLGGTFGFLGAGGDAQHYACVCTSQSPEGVRNWTYNDHGSPFYITENPNVIVTDPFEQSGIQNMDRGLEASDGPSNAVYDLGGRRLSAEYLKKSHQRSNILIRKGRKIVGK